MNSINEINNVSFKSLNPTVNMPVSKEEQSEAVKNLVKYLQDNPISKNDSDSFGSTVKSAAVSVPVFQGIPGLKWLKHAKSVGKNITEVSKGVTGNAGTILKEYSKPVTEALKGFTKKGVKFSQKYANYSNAVNTFTSQSANLSAAMKTASKAGENVIRVGGELTPVVNTAAKASKLGKFGKVLGNAGSKASKFMGKFGKFGKAIKNNAAFLALSGVIEFGTEVLPTYKQLGKKAGTKQLLKSTVKVGADIGGFAAGGSIGAKIGAAIGSIFPGVGTAIGAAVGGFVGGIIGSAATSKIAKKVTGPTERELAAEKELQEQVNQISSDNNEIESLKELAAQKINETYAQTGKIDEDTKVAIQELDKLNSVQKQNPFTEFAM